MSRSRAMHRLPLLLLLALLGCARPPESAYVTATPGTGPADPAGKDARGEDCAAQRGAALPADLPVARSREVYCGGWTQPAARVVELRGTVDAARLDALAAGGLWRTWLDQRVTCAAPQATTLAGGVPARLLA